MKKIDQETTRLESAVEESRVPEEETQEVSGEVENQMEVESERMEEGSETPGEEGAIRTGQGEDPEAVAKDELVTLQNDLDQLKDQHLRLAADFENYRKRVSGELASGWVRAQADLAHTLLEGLDDLQRVSQFTSDDTTLESLIEGVDLVERKLMKALTAAGLEVFDPTGEVFDPNTMEAMMRVPTEEPGQDETVHQVFQKGYMFKDQLLRPARVSVYKDDD